MINSQLTDFNVSRWTSPSFQQSKPFNLDSECSSVSFVEKLPAELLYHIILEVADLALLCCVCKKIYNLFLAHLSSPSGIASFIQYRCEPLIAQYSQKDAYDIKNGVVEEVFQRLLYLPYDVCFPPCADTKTVPIMRRLFARLETLCRPESTFNPFTPWPSLCTPQKGDPLVVRLYSITQALVHDNPSRLTPFLYNLPSVYLIDIESTSAVSEISRRYDSGLLTNDDTNTLYNLCGYDARSIRSCAKYLIEGASAKFLKSILHIYACPTDKDPKASDEDIVSQGISDALSDLSPSDNDKLLVFLEFYKAKYLQGFKGWQPSSQQEVLRRIVESTLRFLYKHLFSDLLLHHGIGSWMYDHVEQDEKQARRGPYASLSTLKHLFLPMATFVHDRLRSGGDRERAILQQLNEEFLPLGTLDTASLTLPLGHDSFLYYLLQTRVRLIFEQTLPFAIAYCSPRYEPKSPISDNKSLLELWRIALAHNKRPQQLFCEQELIARLLSGTLKQADFLDADLAYMHEHGSYLSTVLECIYK